MSSTFFIITAATCCVCLSPIRTGILLEGPTHPPPAIRPGPPPRPADVEGGGVNVRYHPRRTDERTNERTTMTTTATPSVGGGDGGVVVGSGDNRSERLLGGGRGGGSGYYRRMPTPPSPASPMRGAMQTVAGVMGNVLEWRVRVPLSLPLLLPLSFLSPPPPPHISHPLHNMYHLSLHILSHHPSRVSSPIQCTCSPFPSSSATTTTTTTTTHPPPPAAGQVRLRPLRLFQRRHRDGVLPPPVRR